jgi:hypothetical protein
MVMRRPSRLTGSTMPYLWVSLFGHGLDADHVAADLVIDLDQLFQRAGLSIDDDVGQHDGEGLVADDVAGAPDGVAQSPWAAIWRVKLISPALGSSARSCLRMSVLPLASSWASSSIW